MQHLTSVHGHKRQDKTRRHARQASVLALATLPLAISQAFGTEVTSVWDGSFNGDYNTAANWTPNGVPLNNDLTTYIVQIGTGSPVTVNYTSLTGDVDGFLLNAKAIFNLSDGGNAFAPASFEVLGAAQIAGSIVANNSSFIAGAAGTSFVGNTATISASGGSVVRIGATNYDASGVVGGTLLYASGNGSQIDLSTVKSFNSGFTNPNAFTNTVLASNGGAINLSGVTSIVAPAINTAQTLLFNATSAGTINLSSVNTISGVTADTGVTKFTATGGTINLGPLTSANQMQIDLESASTMNIGGATTPAALTNSMFKVGGGSVLNGSTLRGTDTVKGLVGQTFISADGTGSVLNLSGLTKIDSGFTNPNSFTNTVLASDGGAINLSGVTAVVAPAINSSQTLQFYATTGGSIDLSSLQSITSASTGQTQFKATGGGSILLHGIAAGPNVNFNLTDNNSTLTVAGNFSLLNGSTLSAGNGTHIDINGNYTFQQSIGSQVNTDLATMAFQTSGTHTMEVGGKNMSLPSGTTVVQGDFGVGELDVGQASTANKVELVNLVANNNGSPDNVLYLNGVNGGNGLHILDGSTLVLTQGVDLYATQNGQWTYINSLFKNGATTIAYDQGFITTVPEPSSVALLLSGIGFIAFRRRASRSPD